ncbi:unnamed protein product, partial [Allacma fusca]
MSPFEILSRDIREGDGAPQEGPTAAGEDLLTLQHSLHEEYHMYSDAEARVINAKVSVFCIVMCTAGDSTSQAKLVNVINRTWGARCSNIIFVSRFNNSLKVEEATVVSFPELNRGMAWMWGRTKAALNYTWYNHRYEADWFLKVDDTNYVIMENLRFYLQEEQSSKPLYLGYKLKPYTKQGYMYGGK